MRGTTVFPFARRVLILGAAALPLACLGTMEGAPELELPYAAAVAYAPGEIALEEESFDEALFEADRDPVPVTAPVTVGQLIDRRGCSTAPTMPLNAQIAEQMNCIEDGFFARIDDIPNVSLGGGANPFLQGPAASALRRVAGAAPGTSLEVTSSWRSVAQQYVLQSWRGSCGISVVASPGGSNHESGLAIDVPLSTTTAFRSALRSAGFRWYCDATNGGRSSGCADVPHHDYTAGGVDLRSRSVLAFQQLWNRAHPEDRIGADGVFGLQTASRIRRAPLAGFPTGTTCDRSVEVCGDGRCGPGEDCASCPSDCGPCERGCGDGRCGPGEDCASCPSDCGPCGEGCGVEGHGGSGENGETCTAPAETWRCVQSDRWSAPISQVCRSGRWLTFEIDPRDCAACCGDYSIACRG